MTTARTGCRFRAESAPGVRPVALTCAIEPIGKGGSPLRTRTLLLLSVVALGACEGDAEPLTGPPDEFPNVALLDPPARVDDGKFVSVSFFATDDVGLDEVTVWWGEVGTALEVLPVAGDSAAWTRSHMYDRPGFYTIRIQATDTSDQVVTRVWGVTVDPSSGAIAAITRTSGTEADGGGYNLLIDDEFVAALQAQDSVLVEHVPAGPHDLLLADVAANCDVTIGDTTVVEFTISCN